MAQELIYTSAQKGLRPGTRGFCTVAYTKSLHPEAIHIMESLSAYTNLYPVHDSRAEQNPISYRHYLFKMAHRDMSIISRVGPTLADHTHRTNKLAHHILLSKRERIPAGPAWLLCQQNLFRQNWNEEPHRISEEKTIPNCQEENSTFSPTWETITGDAGWAGMLAYAYMTRPKLPSFIIFEPGMNIIPLFKESMNLLAPEIRWNITFDTYYTTAMAGSSCLWRGCVPNADALREAKRDKKILVIDLTRKLTAPPDNTLVKCAREGLPVPTNNQIIKKQRLIFKPLVNRSRANTMRPYKRKELGKNEL